MIDKLEMFLALAKARHFGRAAEARGISQPSLSAAIRSLEAELGVQLVRRGARFQGLTPEGEAALGWARRIVADARQMRAELRDRDGGLAGALRLGVIPTALPLAGRLVAPLLAQHPGLAVSIQSMTSAELLAGIEALTLEAGISYLDNEPLGRVATLPLYRESYRLLVARDHPLAAHEALGWADLAGQRLCLLGPEMQNRRIVDARLAAAGVSPRVGMQSNSILALAGLVAAGGWAAVVADEVARVLTGDGQVAIPIRETGGQGGFTLGLIAPARDPALPAVAALWALAQGGRRRDRPSTVADPVAGRPPRR